MMPTVHPNGMGPRVENLPEWGRHIVENVQGKIVPSLRKNHGPDSIEEISTARLLSPVRIFHNYVPLVNMRQGILSHEWPGDAIFVG